MRAQHNDATRRDTDTEIGEATADALVAEVTDAIMIDVAIKEDLDNFLADPIGFGDFDYSDPIDLCDYTDNRIRGFYIEPLT